MEPKRGYYSLIQFSPDSSRLEAVNVGVLLFCPESRFLAARTATSNHRAAMLVGRDGLDEAALNSAKRAIERRLEVDREAFQTLEDLQRFVALRGALGPLGEAVQLAFVFGSVAAGEERQASDVDLFVVGTASFADVVGALCTAQVQLRREINPAVYPPGEFRSKLAAGHHFLRTVLAGAKVFVIGGEHELANLADQPLAHGTSGDQAGDRRSVGSRTARSGR